MVRAALADHGDSGVTPRHTLFDAIALGIPVEMFTVMFAIARTAGWVSHWLEQQEDPENRIGRPRQIYTGAGSRDYVDMGQR